MMRAPWICALATFFPASAASAQSQPNLLLVVVDDLGPEYVACYRQHATPPATPTLDLLAAKGARFANAYANPVCTPTRACLMTGRHAWRSGMEVTCMPGDAGLQDSEWILPEAMTSRGYASALIGKWHLGDRHGAATPNVQGWPHFVGALYGNIPSYTQWQKTANGVSVQATAYATTDQVNDALTWIRAQQQPWMLMLNFHAPHTPLHAPPAHLHRQSLSGLNPATSPIPFYKAMVESVDAEIARLLRGIAPMAATTNVIVISDNGAPDGIAVAPPSRAKGSLYEAGCRVPLIVSGPVVATPGAVIQDRVHAVDLFATLWELTGGVAANAPVQLDGTSLVPLLRGQSLPPRAMYTETIGTGFGSGCARIDGNHKLIRFSDDPVMFPHEELYDLRADPRETTNLLRSPLAPQDVAAYQALDAGLWTQRARGHIERFGTQCPTSVGDVRLKSYAPPTVGMSHHMRVLTPDVGVNTLLFASVVYLGLNAVHWNGIPLPASLAPIGMPSCSLQVSPDLILYVGLTDALFAVPMPMDPTLAGTVAYAQSFVADPLANPAGLAASAGYRFTIGL